MRVASVRWEGGKEREWSELNRTERDGLAPNFPFRPQGRSLRTCTDFCSFGSIKGEYPPHYNLEIPKTVWRIREANAKHVALQIPPHVCPTFLRVLLVLGACCVDDFSASSLGVDFFVHYGYSCLVPIDHSLLPCLCVFVEIHIDVLHHVDTVKLNFHPEEKIALTKTIQSAPHSAKAALCTHFANVGVPQAKPLSGGEVPGCTAASMPRGSVYAIVFVADGRFHLEAFIIAIPDVKVILTQKYCL